MRASKEPSPFVSLRPSEEGTGIICQARGCRYNRRTALSGTTGRDLAPRSGLPLSSSPQHPGQANPRRRAVSGNAAIPGSGEKLPTLQKRTPMADQSRAQKKHVPPQTILPQRACRGSAGQWKEIRRVHQRQGPPTLRALHHRQAWAPHPGFSRTHMRLSPHEAFLREPALRVNHSARRLEQGLLAEQVFHGGYHKRKRSVRPLRQIRLQTDQERMPFGTPAGPLGFPFTHEGQSDTGLHSPRPPPHRTP
jgi:hypothetical protein